MAQFRISGNGLHELQILLYVCSLLKVARPHISNPIIYAAKAARQSCSKLNLKVQRLSLKGFHNKVIRPNGFEFDLNCVVLVSPKTAITLSVKNGQWLNVAYCLKDRDEDSSQVVKISNVQHRWIVLCISSDIPNDYCMASPILYHNLAQNTHGQDIMIEFTNDFQYFMSSAIQKILVLWEKSHGTKLSREDDVTIQNGPYYASEVQVKFIESLKYKCGNQLESLINDHFSIPKTVTFNDVLMIPVPSHLAHEFATNSSIVPPKYVFIKVSAVKGKTGAETQQTVLVNKDITSLYLSGSTQCSIPSLIENVRLNCNNSVPPVLATAYDKLKSIMDMDVRSKIQDMRNCSLDFKVCAKCEEEYTSDETFIPDDSFSKSPGHADVDSSHIYYKKCSLNSPSVLFLGPSGNGVEEIVNLAASDLGLEVLWIDAWHIKGDTSGTTEARLRQTFLRAVTQSPCVLAIKNIPSIAKDNDGNEDTRVVSALREEISKLQTGVFLVATAPHRSQVSADLWSVWSHQETIEVPDLYKRSMMLEWLFSLWVPKADLQTLAQRTAGYIFGDFQALFVAAQRMCLYQMSASDDISTESKNITSIGDNIPPLTYEDIQKALDELQSSRSEALGAPRIPQVRWKEVGGLEDAKREVVNTIQLPLSHPALVSSGLRRSGVLLYGPPGTGKTLLAKAVATECGLNFMSVKGPELLNMYVGQSEENVRQVFSRARAAAPCVIFFDELDSLAPNRGRSGDSGGVMDRIVSALLAELDGVASTADVFVLAATNRPDLIDPALLRPGRFEKLVFLGVCKNRADQVKILQAVTSKIPLVKDVSLKQVAEMLPLTLTGADLYAVCTDALYTALQRTTQQIASGEIREEDGEIQVQESDFRIAAEQLVPSVTPRELVHYRSMKTNQRR